MNHLYCPTYYRGPFVASNIADMYCTECIIGIIQNAGTPSRLRFARTRRDEGGIEPPVLSYILQRPIRSVQYCESTPRSQVILAMIVPVVVGPLAGHANSLSAPLQRPIRSASKYCESTTHPVYHAKITVSTKNFPRSEGDEVPGGPDRVAWLDGRKNVLFLRWRGERYILHRATGFPYISYILPCRLNSFTRSLKGLYTPHPRG